VKIFDCLAIKSELKNEKNGRPAERVSTGISPLFELPLPSGQ